MVMRYQIKAASVPAAERFTPGQQVVVVNARGETTRVRVKLDDGRLPSFFVDIAGASVEVARTQAWAERGGRRYWHLSTMA